MPRMTKEQLAELQQSEQTRTWVEFVQNYPYRFSAMLYQYPKRNKTVEQVEPALYRFETEWQSVVLPVVPSAEYNYETISSLETVERELELALEKEREELRQHQVRLAALAKLSNEERELLGL
jgi:hypothetical protein